MRVQTKFKLSSQYSRKKYILILTAFLIFFFATTLHSQINRLSTVALRIRPSDGSISTASFVKYGDATNFTYFIITAYHCIYKQRGIDISYDGAQYFNINEFIDKDNSLFIEPSLDLAVFRCSDAGWHKLINEFFLMPLEIVSDKPYNVDVRAIGNPTLDMAGEQSIALNHPAWACINEYSEFNRRLPSELAYQRAKDTIIMILESLHVTYGYSGGPVVFSESGFRKPDYKLAGIIQGGIPGKLKSWAIPSESINRSIASALEVNSFSSYPPQEQDWPEPCFNYGPLYYTHSNIISFYCEIIDRTPTVYAEGTSFLDLFVNEVNRISIVLKISGTGNELTAVIQPQEWLMINKTPSIKHLVNNEGIVAFEWEIVPVKEIVGSKEVEVIFYSSRREQDFSLKLKSRLSKRLPKNNLYNLSFNIATSTDLKTRRAGSLSFYRRLNNMYAIGLELGQQFRKVSKSYDVLSGLPKGTIEREIKTTYLGGLLRFSPKIIQSKNIEPYIGIGFGFPLYSQVLLGLDLKIYKYFELGIESRIIYHKSKTYDVIFNYYGDAMEEMKKEYKFLFSLGVKIGINFQYMEIK